MKKPKKKSERAEFMNPEMQNAMWHFCAINNITNSRFLGVVIIVISEVIRTKQRKICVSEIIKIAENAEHLKGLQADEVKMIMHEALRIGAFDMIRRKEQRGKNASV